MSDFKLTYATMFDPPTELHARFDEALANVKQKLGQEYGMFINGKNVLSKEKFEDFSPIDTDMKLALIQKGDESHAQAAISAARKAARGWERTPWQERIRLVRKAADLIDERIFELSAAMSLEVGKNRMESLGDVAETADLMRYACDQMEENNGYVKEMGKDPLVGYEARNVSKLRPYGIWLVISPFNFPFALTGGPAGSALVAGNTVIIKPATDTPWIVRQLVDCFVDAGFPEGVVNFVTGPGRTLGQALVDSHEIDGATFTGSLPVGMKIHRAFSSGKYVRPTILELGGKNPVIVSKNADLDLATIGIVRSAFGLQGQKCSAASRVLVEAPVYDDLVERLKDATDNLIVGDPTEKETYMGPVVNKSGFQDFQDFNEEISGAGGKLITGGHIKTGGDFAKGYFCEPTLVADLPLSHRLWKDEMFLPITTIAKIDNLDDAMEIANDVDYGLTAGFYGSEDEIDWFFDNIEAGVVYANRPQGASTGAWPGFQPFGGWKGSGSSGKNAGGHYYLPLYMHEQSQTLVK